MLGLPLHALDPLRQSNHFQVDQWNTTHGIPYTAIRLAYQDSTGFLWIGTRGGLARFDGQSFTTFGKATDPAFIDDEIHAVCEDHNAVLWVGTARGILWLNNGRFESPPQLATFRSERIRWIQRDGEIMLFATNDSLWEFDGTTVAPVHLPPEVSFETFTTAQRFGDDGWIIGANPSWVIPGEHAELLRTPAGGLVQDMWTLLPHSENGWWCGTESGLYTIQDGKMKRVPSIGGIAVPSVRSMLEDHDGNLWIGTRGDLIRVVGGQSSIVEQTGNDSLLNFLCLVEDNEGNIWGGNDAGLIRLGHVKASNITYADGRWYPSSKPRTEIFGPVCGAVDLCSLRPTAKF
ncbi:MAG: hypothetical protein J6386_06940 [Candidatus Synoicihabitans palmerolidicus]|nr:hypothetical protein [Candidatus Synoicihabitans palmerolidicus]